MQREGNTSAVFFLMIIIANPYLMCVRYSMEGFMLDYRLNKQTNKNLKHPAGNWQS